MKVIVVNARAYDAVGAGYILESELQTRPYGEMTAKLEGCGEMQSDVTASV